MKNATVSETNAGVKAKGTWNEICDFLGELQLSLKDYLDEDSAQRLHNWRPRENEDTEELKEKTVEDASLDKKKVEEECGNKKEELKEGSKDIARSVKKAKKGKSKEKLKNGAKKVAKAVGSESIEMLRDAEETVYEKIMLKLNPYYFDDDDFSINFKKERSGEYTINVNATDEELRKDLKRNLV